MSDWVLELEGLHKAYGRFTALQDLSLQVPRGQVLGFLGPNGAGKTTTLRLITGLLRPTRGAVRVCGHDITRHPLEAKRRTAFISDRPYLYEKLTGGEFLRFVGGLWGMAPPVIEERGARWLARFDLAGWEGEPVEAYSHGMRQRLLLCSALMHEPDLLLLDEPMVGLDPRGAVQLKEVLRELAAKRALSVVLSTHTLDVVEQICDAVVIIHRGRAVVSGALEDVRRAHGGGKGRLEEIFLRVTGGTDDRGELLEAPHEAAPETAEGHRRARS